MQTNTRRILLIAVAVALLSISPRAQDGAVDDNLRNDETYVGRLVKEIPSYTTMTPMQKVQALRVHVFKTTPLAAVEDFKFDGKVTKISLEQVYARLQAENKGLWCGGTASLLARVYSAAGFDAWVYSFGAPGILNHSTTLVRVDSEIYLQDAYLNFEYVDEEGRLLPFMQILSRISDRRPPPVRSHVTNKIGLFLNENNVRTWTGAHYQMTNCEPLERGLRCNGPITLDRFLEVFFLMDRTYDFLAREGFERRVDYLMLYPRYLVSGEGEAVQSAKDLLAQIKALPLPY